METIKENYLFKKAYTKGKKQTGKYLVLYALNSKHGVRYGVTVSKKIGKAVVRNRVRRKIKECFRYLEPFVKDGTELVFVARGASVDASFNQLFDAMKTALMQGGIISEENIDYPYQNL